MTKGTKPLLLALLCGAFLYATPSYALPEGGCVQAGTGPCENAMRGPMHGCPEFTRQNITPEQREKYAALLQEFEPKMRAIREQLFVKETVLDALKHAVQPDVVKIEQTAMDIVQLRNAKRELRIALAERAEKECGIKRGPRPLPGLDYPPHHMHHGSYHNDFDHNRDGGPRGPRNPQ